MQPTPAHAHVSMRQTPVLFDDQANRVIGPWSALVVPPSLSPPPPPPPSRLSPTDILFPPGIPKLEYAAASTSPDQSTHLSPALRAQIAVFVALGMSVDQPPIPHAVASPAGQSASWSSPQLEELARQFWLAADLGPSMPVAEPPASPAGYSQAGPSSLRLQTDDMPPRKRRATSSTGRRQLPSNAVPSRTSADVRSGEGAPSTSSLTTVTRAERSSPQAAATPSGSASAAAPYNLPKPASATQVFSGSRNTFAEVPHWDGEFYHQVAVMSGGDGLTIDGSHHPVAPPRYNASPRPSTSGEGQYSGAVVPHPAPIPQWAAGPSNFSSPDAFGFTFGPYDQLEDQDETLGLRVQVDNISVPRSQSQNQQGAVDRPIAGSSRATGQTSGTTQSSTKPWAKGGRVAFKDSVNGKRCAELKLTANTPGPFRCFACDEKGCHQPEPYPTWAKFKTHVYRCQPKDKSLWPRCPFCGDAVPAVNRAWEMERHFAGNGKKRPCPELKRLMDAGMKTNGAIGDWLRAKPHPIETRYLGSRLAEAFYRAAYWRQGRDVLVVL